jgi:hypothetical protein
MATIIDFKVINNNNINDEINDIENKLKELYNKLGKECNIKIFDEIIDCEIILKIYKRNVKY